MIADSPMATLKSVISAAPSGYLVAWFVGIPVEKWAAFFAMVWSIWLIVDKLVSKIRHHRNLTRIRREDAERVKRRAVVERVVAGRDANGLQ